MIYGYGQSPPPMKCQDSQGDKQRRKRDGFQSPSLTRRELCGEKADAVIIRVGVGTEIYPAQETAFGFRVAVKSHTDRAFFTWTHRLFGNIHGYA